MEKSLSVEKMTKYRECGTHEKRSSDELQRLCESCGRNYFLCEMCRNVKNYNVNLLNFLIVQAPSYFYLHVCVLKRICMHADINTT